MLNCEIIRDLLPQYMAGTLSPSSKAAIEEHTLTCPICAKLLEYQMPLAARQETHNLWKTRLHFWIPVSVLLLILLIAVTTLIPKLLPQDANSDWVQVDSPKQSWSAKVQQQGDSFALHILSDDASYQQLSLDGIYKTMFWTADGSYLAIAYIKDDWTCTCIYDSAKRTTRFLDSTFTQTLRYQHGAFSFLSGRTTQDEGMHYMPWTWNHLANSLLIYSKGTDSEGWSYLGYFWYNLSDGTIGGATGFEDSFLDIPKTPIPLPPISNSNT